MRAARNGEKYNMIIIIPAVPAFAGDLKLDEALGTRAIMECQYTTPVNMLAKFTDLF